MRRGGTPGGRLVVSLLIVAALGCAPRGGQGSRARAPFAFPADTLAYANDTVWEWGPDPRTGEEGWFRVEPRSPFVLRCGIMARAARQFWVHALFDPNRPVVDEARYRELVREVMARDARRKTPAPTPVVIPGYRDLRAFSGAHEGLLKETIGGPWRSYMQRGNWRMIFPFSMRNQQRMAEQLAASVARHEPPLVHVLRFPEQSMNHKLLIYDVERTPTELRFASYDVNDTENPLVLRYDRAARSFYYPRAPYFQGGPVQVYEIYDGLLF